MGGDLTRGQIDSGLFVSRILCKNTVHITGRTSVADTDPHESGTFSWIRNFYSGSGIFVPDPDPGKNDWADKKKLSLILAVLRSRGRWSRNYFKPGAGTGAKIIFAVNIY